MTNEQDRRSQKQVRLEDDTYDILGELAVLGGFVPNIKGRGDALKLGIEAMLKAWAEQGVQVKGVQVNRNFNQDGE